MGAVPIPRTFSAGEVETGAYLQNLSNALAFLLNPPRVSVYPSAAQSIPNNVVTSLLMDVEVFDTDSMHSTVTNTSRLTIVTPGTYEIRASLGIAGNATGVRQPDILKNGSIIGTVTQGTMSGTAGVVHSLSAPDVVLAAGDYIELAVTQNSGAALNTLTGPVNTWLAARWVAT